MQRAIVSAVVVGIYCASCVMAEPRRWREPPRDPHAMFAEAIDLKTAGLYAEAVPLLERSIKIWEGTLGPRHFYIGAATSVLGDIYSKQGQYARAEPLFQRSAEIYEARFGPNDSSVAQALDGLARNCVKLGQPARANKLFERILSILEANRGPNDHEVATARSRLANTYQLQRQYEKAEVLFQRTLALAEAARRPEPLAIAAALDNLANLYTTSGRYGQAEPLYERALVLREAALSPNHTDIAHTLHLLANLYQEQKQYGRAEALHVRALEMRERGLGPKHPDVAESLHLLAMLYYSQGFYPRAEPLIARALQIRETVLGPAHSDVAESMTALAALYNDQGLYERMEGLHIRALGIAKAALGEAHPHIATSLNNLASFYGAHGQRARAEPLLLQALQIQEAAFGPSHPEMALTLNNLAICYSDQGLHARAEPLYSRALEIARDAFGEDHPEIALSLNNLASLYIRQGQDARAEPLYSRALEIREAALDPRHPAVAQSLNNLAVLYTSQGLYVRAEPLLRRALQIQEATLGPQHPDVALSLNSLAHLYTSQGLYARAEPLLRRALQIEEAAFGPRHPNVVNSLNGLARLYLAQGRLDVALPLIERALTISELHLRQEVFSLSEERLAGVLHRLRAQEELLNALVRAHPSDVRVLRLALSSALLRKGRSVQEVANTSRIIHHHLDPADRQAFERLRSLRTHLARRMLAAPERPSPADHQQRLKELAEERDALEVALSRRSEPFRRLHALPPFHELISRVAAALPSDSALVEFVAYYDYPVVPPPGVPPSRVPSHLRYLALLLFADGRAQAVDLGPAEPVNRATRLLLDALSGKVAAYQPDAQALYELAFRPLVPHLGKVRRLFLAPDDQLHLVPFAALHDGSHFLMDSLDITYLTSGKDLLRRVENLPAQESVVVLAAPDFGSPVAPSPAEQMASSGMERSASLEQFFSAVRAGSRDSLWRALPGTRKEAEMIKGLFPQARLFLAQAATKEALLELSAPGLLHIATHGFFLEASSHPPGSRGEVSFGLLGARLPTCPPEPMLCSGLVLAGAGASTPRGGSLPVEESWVTALELASMNLWGTQLVVLSACETGRGDVKLGQGVFGLRRALVAAGAETLVMSLWKVNDTVTSELMEGYYTHLLAGQGRTQALREAMMELRQKQPHPHFWAPFISLGLDTPLRMGRVRSAQSPGAR